MKLSVEVRCDECGAMGAASIGDARQGHVVRELVELFLAHHRDCGVARGDGSASDELGAAAALDGSTRDPGQVPAAPGSHKDAA